MGPLFSAMEALPLLPPCVALLALHPARRTKAESLHDERMVVLFVALLVGPIVGSHSSLDEQLIALARVSRYRLAQGSEGHKPQARDHFARSALLVLARVVGADQAEARVGHTAPGDELWITGQVTDGGQCETVHKRSSATLASVLMRVMAKPMGASLDRLLWKRIPKGCVFV
jgi:hypothetical protein